MNASEPDFGTENWRKIGHDIDDLSREMGNEVESKENILGDTSVTVTKAPQKTTVDPIYIDDADDITETLYQIYWHNKDGSDVEREFLEVAMFRGMGGKYNAFKQVGAVDIKSWGGDTKGVNAPFDIHWKGERVFGLFDPETMEFTPAQ